MCVSALTFMCQASWSSSRCSVRMTLTVPCCPVHAGHSFLCSLQNAPACCRLALSQRRKRPLQKRHLSDSWVCIPGFGGAQESVGAFMNTSSRMIWREPQPSQGCAHRQGLPRDVQGLLDLQPSPGVCVAQPRPSD